MEYESDDSMADDFEDIVGYTDEDIDDCLGFPLSNDIRETDYDGDGI